MKTQTLGDISLARKDKQPHWLDHVTPAGRSLIHVYMGGEQEGKRNEAERSNVYNI